MIIPAWVSSMTPMIKTVAVSLNNETKKLTNDGIIILNACGSTTNHIALYLDKPVVSAASSCPLGTASIPALTISASYAAAYTLREITALQKIVILLPKTYGRKK